MNESVFNSLATIHAIDESRRSGNTIQTHKAEPEEKVDQEVVQEEPGFDWKNLLTAVAPALMSGFLNYQCQKAMSRPCPPSDGPDVVPAAIRPIIPKSSVDMPVPAPTPLCPVPALVVKEPCTPITPVIPALSTSTSIPASTPVSVTVTSVAPSSVTTSTSTKTTTSPALNADSMISVKTLLELAAMMKPNPTK
jgi:hypothetical protein